MVNVSSTIFDVTNLNDTKPLQLFLGINQSRTQVYNGNTGDFVPDWNTSNPVITPELYIAGTATNILSQAKSISWFDGASAITSGTAGYSLGASNQSLTINTNVLAGKNLVPSFDSSRWFADSSSGAGSMAIDSTDRYKMTLTLTATSQGRLVQIPVITGKTYTLSCSNATTGLRKLYKGQQTSDGGPTVLLDATTNNFTFTVDSSYGGYVTIRLIQGSAGSYVFQDLQLEMGATATAFAPMDVDSTKSIVCEVVYTDPDTNTDMKVHGQIDFTLTATAQNGAQGSVAGDIAVLDNDTAVVTTANDGSGGTYGAPNTQTNLKIYRGTTSGTIDVTSQYTISQARNNVTVTEATNSATATVTAMSADTGSVVFTATLAGYPTITKTFSLAKSKMGVVGQNPTDWWVNVSSSTITAADNGAYTPSSVTVSAESQTGTNTPTAYAGRFIIQESTDGSAFTTTYTSAADESSHAYTPSAGLKAIKVQMFQAGGTSVKLDEQIIPIIGNGKNSVKVNAWTPGGNIIHNAGNTVTAEADLLNGGLPDTGTNYRWVKSNSGATSVIAGSGFEDLDLGKRNLVLNSAFINGFTSWGNGSAIPYSIDSSTYNNNPVVTINNTNTFSASSAYMDLTQSIYNLQPSTQYTISLWVKGSGQRFETYLVEFKEATSNTTTTTTYIDHGTIYTLNGTTYTLVTSTFTTQSDCGSGRLYIRTFGQTQVWFTEVKMEQSGAATPWIAAYEDNTIDPTDTTLYGKNVLRNTSAFANLTNWQLSMGSGQTGLLEIVTDATKGQVLHASKTNSVNWWVVQNPMYLYYPAFDTTKKYSISFDIKSVNSTNFGVAIMDGNGTHPVLNTTTVTTSTSWARKYLTFTPLISGNQPMFYLTGNIDDYYITNIKIEQLPYATDYTPAPEDNSSSYPNLSAGENKWQFSFYSDNGSIRVVGYNDIKPLTPVYKTLLTDTTNLVQNISDNYIGYLKTAVYVSTAKTITTSFNVDDSEQVYVNGLPIFSQSGVYAKTLGIPLQAGWNTIEFIGKEATGNDLVWNFNPLISSLVEEMNCNYALDYGSAKGNYGLIGYNTSSMIVNTNAVNDTDQFMCLVTYRGSTYKDSVTIDDVSDPITIIINGTRVFKNDTGTNTYTASLWQNGTEIDTGGTDYTYTWYVYNSDGSLDTSFGGTGSKTGKTITVASTDIVNTTGRLQCQVSK